jgi:competence protein ComEA
VDLDRADVQALERLPRIGPALAARIVDDRKSNGPYGSLEELQRVRGIGPKLAAVLRAHVTFSASPRPSSVQR